MAETFTTWFTVFILDNKIANQNEGKPLHAENLIWLLTATNLVGPLCPYIIIIIIIIIIFSLYCNLGYVILS